MICDSAALSRNALRHMERMDGSKAEIFSMVCVCDPRSYGSLHIWILKTHSKKTNWVGICTSSWNSKILVWPYTSNRQHFPPPLSRTPRWECGEKKTVPEDSLNFIINLFYMASTKRWSISFLKRHEIFFEWFQGAVTFWYAFLITAYSDITFCADAQWTSPQHFIEFPATGSYFVTADWIAIIAITSEDLIQWATDCRITMKICALFCRKSLTWLTFWLPNRWMDHCSKRWWWTKYGDEKFYYHYHLVVTLFTVWHYYRIIAYVIVWLKFPKIK